MRARPRARARIRKCYGPEAEHHDENVGRRPDFTEVRRAIHPRFLPDLPGLVQRRAAAGEAGLASFRAIRNIPYGPRPEETLNLFPAENTTGLTPLHIFIHGGFWRSMEAAQFGFLARGFVPFGATLAIIDYPLMPNVRSGGHCQVMPHRYCVGPSSWLGIWLRW